MKQEELEVHSSTVDGIHHDICSIILKPTYPNGKLDHESLIWRHEGVRQQKLDYSIKITISICKPMKVIMKPY